MVGRRSKTREQLYRGISERAFVAIRTVRSAAASGTTLDLFRSRFPFCFADPPAPRIVQLELTNSCNLNCAYCWSKQASTRPRGFMNDRTFANLLRHLREFSPATLRVVGGGEPTLHPKFVDYVESLAISAKSKSLTTNGQAVSEKNIPAISASFNLVEVSVDGCDTEQYERQRVGGRFCQLLRNLEALRSEAARTGSGMELHVRIMLRPSEVANSARLGSFWRKHGDSISIQRLRTLLPGAVDLFPSERSTEFVRCKFPFKGVSVHWNGDVPACDAIELSPHPEAKPRGQLGTINSHSLLELWAGDTARTLRRAHRSRSQAMAPYCVGCPAIW